MRPKANVSITKRSFQSTKRKGLAHRENKGVRGTSLTFAKSKIGVSVALKSHPMLSVNKTTGHSLKKNNSDSASHVYLK